MLMLSVYGVFWPQNLCLGNTCGFNHLNVVWASFGAIPFGKKPEHFNNYFKVTPLVL